MSIGAITRAANVAGKSRMAGSAWQKFLQWAKNTAQFGATGSLGAMDNKELAKALALRFVPDAVGGTIVGATTPGDLGDKIIAGTTDALGGAIGGIGLSGATRFKGSLNIAADMAGSLAGAYGSMPVSEQLLRMKDSMSGGKGQSPYERLSEENRIAIEQALLTRLGFGPTY